MTVREALSAIKDEKARKRALELAGYNNRLDREIDTYVNAIKGAFVWVGTVEGHEYWKEQNKLLNEQFYC